MSSFNDSGIDFPDLPGPYMPSHYLKDLGKVVANVVPVLKDDIYGILLSVQILEEAAGEPGLKELNDRIRALEVELSAAKSAWADEMTDVKRLKTQIKARDEKLKRVHLELEVALGGDRLLEDMTKLEEDIRPGNIDFGDVEDA